MKKFLELFFSLLCFQTYAQVTFQKIYHINNYFEKVFSVCISTDGNYMTAGAHWDGINDKAFLMKTDLNGNLIWRKVFPGLDRFFSIIVSNDGGYALTGHSDSLVQGDDEMILLKTDSSGNVQWCKLFGFTNCTDYSLSVMQNQNGEYFITGNGHPSFSSTYYLNIIKIDSTGSLIWDKVISSNGCVSFPFFRTI